jgi:hypothetical protein
MRAAGSLYVNGIAAYTTGTDAYWVRVRVLHDLGSGMRTGPELIRHGNSDYRATQAGWTLTGVKLGGATEFGVKLGARRNAGHSTEPYGGVELTTSF